jgi:HEAT repeat protein
MPEDDLLTEEMINEYDAVVTELRSLRDPRMIRPLIYSFGYGEGCGVYQGVVGLLEKYDVDQVAPYLFEAIQEGERGSRMWAASMLRRSRNLDAIPHLIMMLHDPEELVRVEAVGALGILADQSVRLEIEALRNDSSAMVKRAVERALARLTP